MPMRQTRDGYLWLTTPAGLVRFDGVRLRVFNRANTPGLTSKQFSLFTLFEDRQGGHIGRRRSQVLRRPLHRLHDQGGIGEQRRYHALSWNDIVTSSW